MREAGKAHEGRGGDGALRVVSGRMRAVVCGLGGVTVRRRGGATV